MALIAPYVLSQPSVQCLETNAQGGKVTSLRPPNLDMAELGLDSGVCFHLCPGSPRILCTCGQGFALVSR